MPDDTAHATQGDKLGSDSEYDFRFGTKSMLPEGLADLTITEIRSGLLLLDNFDVDLTIDQSWSNHTPERIAMLLAAYVGPRPATIWILLHHNRPFGDPEATAEAKTGH